MENNKGTLKREVTTFEVTDVNISNLITKQLTDYGFDVVIKNINDSNGCIIGESITVYRKEIK